MRLFIWSSVFCLSFILGCGGQKGEEPSEASPISNSGDSLLPAAYTRNQTEVRPRPQPKVNVPQGDFQLLTWEDLGDVKFEEKYYEDIGEWLWYPTFGPKVKDAEGEKVYIAGYVIPIQPGRFVLSRSSFSSCFFCGGAGPETVMDLKLVDKSAMFATDDYRTFQGVLVTNDSDIDQLNYILENAELVEE